MGSLSTPPGDVPVRNPRASHLTMPYGGRSVPLRIDLQALRFVVVSA